MYCDPRCAVILGVGLGLSETMSVFGQGSVGQGGSKEEQDPRGLTGVCQEGLHPEHGCARP